MKCSEVLHNLPFMVSCKRSQWVETSILSDKFTLYLPLGKLRWTNLFTVQTTFDIINSDSRHKNTFLLVINDTSMIDGFWDSLTVREKKLFTTLHRYKAFYPQPLVVVLQMQLVSQFPCVDRIRFSWSFSKCWCRGDAEIGMFLLQYRLT